jgi:uncharacterized protein (TIGR03790 family)
MDVPASQKIRLVFLLLIVPLLLCPSLCLALAPGEILVIANDRVSESLQLAGYYMERRQIPRDHLVRISTSPDEHCSRQEYDETIRAPVRKALDRLGKEQRIRCLVVMYGVPLAIRSSASPASTSAAQEGTRDTRAAVDSELALVLAGAYPLEGWLPNPYFLGFREQQTLLTRDTVLMVSRLDGPDAETVRRIVDDAVEVEKKGVAGRAYFDARWPLPTEKHLNGYALYDASLHLAAERMRASGRMEVRLDAQNSLFQPGDCPDAALYCGWYSLAHYVGAFTWARGAIGYHIASGECATLKEKDSQVWCKRMLEEGVAATIGPVYEPYVEAFPLPELFFPVLAEGYMSLAESYLISLPYLSWQMVLIGDPLYQPFRPRE